MTAIEMREAAVKVVQHYRYDDSGENITAGGMAESIERAIRDLPAGDDEVTRLRARVRRLEEAAEAVLSARDWRSGDGDCGEPCDHCTTRRVLAAVLAEREGGETKP